MTCPFDRNVIALHAGGDLPAQAALSVEQHVAVCPECRALLLEYQSLRSLVATSRTDARYPGSALLERRRIPPARRWVAVAVILFIAAATVAVKEVPAVAALIREISMGQIRVQELSAEEAATYQKQEQEEWDRSSHDFQFDAEGYARDAAGKVLAIRTTLITIREAEAAVDYHVLQPRYLPDGYTAEWAAVVLNDRLSDVNIAYRGPGGRGQVVVGQSAPNAPRKVERAVPEGASQTVTVSGEPAVVVKGAWAVGPDGKVQWLAISPVRLTFVKDEQLISVTHGLADFPVEELIKIAESLE